MMHSILITLLASVLGQLGHQASAAPAGGPLAPGQPKPASHHHAAHLIHHEDLPTAHLPVASWERAEPFPLNATRLLEGSVYIEAQQLNSQYLALLDLDRLLHQFRFFAGLSTGGTRPYGGWESPVYQCECAHCQTRLLLRLCSDRGSVI